MSTDSSGESRRTEERENGTQTTVDEGLQEGGPPEMDPSDPSRPPPYNPDYETASPQPNVGWNRDLLEQTGDMDNDSTANRPIGFEALNNSNPDSSSVGSMGTELRHRRNEAQHEPETTEEGEVEVGRREKGGRSGREGGSLTREEMREARLLRLREGRDRRPLSELSGHSFSFKK